MIFKYEKGLIMSNFINEKFAVNGFACDCLIDSRHDKQGKEVTTLRVRALSNKPLKFTYRPREGLVRINNDSRKAECKNLLEKFIGIHDGNKYELVEFFKENGFIFPISFDEYEEFDFNDVFYFIRRVKEIINLIGLIKEPTLRYKKIMLSVCWLLFAENLKIESIDANMSGLETCTHWYLKCLKSKHGPIYGYIQREPNVPGQCAIPDTIYPPKYHVYEDDIDNATFYREHECEGNNYVLDYYDAMDVYIRERGATIYQKRMIDYFFHLTREIGDIVAVDKNKKIVTFGVDDSEIKDRFSEPLKKATIDIAKITVKEELDYAISVISPAYDIDDMTGKWSVPDLYSALMFSIFYMRPDMEIIKECQNPNCGQPFLVSPSNMKKIYCSLACSRAVQQRKHRQRNKEKQYREVIE